MSSGYYPAGAEYDPRAPWNQMEKDVECDADIEVFFTRQCEEHEIEEFAKELLDTLRTRKDVLSVTNPIVEYDDGEVTVYAECAIRITVTYFGNYITGRYTEPEQWEIDDAAHNQYTEILSVNNWIIERA